MIEVKKAIIIIETPALRLWPLAKAVTPALWPLAERPLIEYLMRDIESAGLKQIFLVLQPHQKQVFEYFKKDLGLEKAFKKNKEDKFLLGLKSLQDWQQSFTIHPFLQSKKTGLAQVLLRAKAKLGKSPFVLMTARGVGSPERSTTGQLIRMFKTCQKSVVGLVRVPQSEISQQVVVEVEKIAHRFFKLKKIIEKPVFPQAPSGLVVSGNFIFTPEIFPYLRQKTPTLLKDNSLNVLMAGLLQEGKVLYGYELEGEWFSLRDELDWLKAHFYFSLRHSKYGPELKRYLKERF